MTPKKNRPHTLSFRTTFDQADDLKREARKNGVNLSVYLNDLILKHYGRG